ncbi:hypothetical protein ACMYSQ_012544 [Aspergillus niger]
MSSYPSMLGSEDDASIYSRSLDSRKLGLVSRAPPVCPPAGFDLPDINPLDHQIALARGSTMATTRTCLQAVKSARRRSVPETLKDKRQQWEQQERENQFYEYCLHIFQNMTAVAIDVSQELSLLQLFEPESTWPATLAFRKQPGSYVTRYGKHGSGRQWQSTGPPATAFCIVLIETAFRTLSPRV